MEKKKKIITFEQLLSGAIVNYNSIIKRTEIFEMIGFVCQMDEYDFMNSSLIDIEKYLLIEKDDIQIKGELSLDMPTIEHPDITLRERLMQVAGIDALNIINLYISKGCVNCVNSNCLVPHSERNGIENGRVFGNKCTKWKNEKYKKMILSKKD